MTHQEKRESRSFIITAPTGYEGLVSSELSDLGVAEMRQVRSEVHFRGDAEMGMRSCLWLRCASRVLVVEKTFEVNEEKDIYRTFFSIDWPALFSPDKTFAISADIFHAPFRNSAYLALVAKDAVVDSFREAGLPRPTVDRRNPDIRLVVRIEKKRGFVCRDMSGESLHRRGYRTVTGEAPLKENLAAALLFRAGWKDVAHNGGVFFDPMCGTGTLPIEAALIAGGIAPGILRRDYSFFHWRDFASHQWEHLLGVAAERAAIGIKKIPPIFASDWDDHAVEAMQTNWNNAFGQWGGGDSFFSLKKGDVTETEPPAKYGLVGMNPPYGHRLDANKDLFGLYAKIGERLRNSFHGWKGFLFAGSGELFREARLRPEKSYVMSNGSLECTAAFFSIAAERNTAKKEDDGSKDRKDSGASSLSDARPTTPQIALGEGGEMFVNRLKKNLRELRKWRKRENISSFRLYDADMPQYAAAIDFYEGSDICLAEYAPPASIPNEVRKKRLEEMVAGVSLLLDVPRRRIHIRERRRQRGKQQYERRAFGNRYGEISEGGLRFSVNYEDYLDTGIFLDHRGVREAIREGSEGADFLNLYAYTGTATVYAAAGGARSTTNVDTSLAYLEWGERNLRLNGFGSMAKHRSVESDCLEFLRSDCGSYDLIFINPPVFSNSKKREGTFDLKRDYGTILSAAGRRLSSGGFILFSTTLRGFDLRPEAESLFTVNDISDKIAQPDFKRGKIRPQCWVLMRVCQS